MTKKGKKKKRQKGKTNKPSTKHSIWKAAKQKLTEKQYGWGEGSQTHWILPFCYNQDSKPKEGIHILSMYKDFLFNQYTPFKKFTLAKFI